MRLDRIHAGLAAPFASALSRNLSGALLLCVAIAGLSAPAPARAAATGAQALPAIETVEAPKTLKSAHAPEALETLGDDHRVREGHAGPDSERLRDAEAASRGVFAGAAPALFRRANDVWVADLDVALRGNRDGDSFFSAVEFTLDVDTAGISQDVYAVITLTDPVGYLTLEHVSATFSLYGRSTSDRYRIEIELLQNHAPDYRDAYVEIHDAYDGRLLDSLAPYEHAALADLPLESTFDDSSSHVDHGIHSGHSDDSGIAGGFAFTGSSSDHGHIDDTYVGAYAASATPFGLILLAFLALSRLAGNARSAARAHLHHSLRRLRQTPARWPSNSRLSILPRRLQHARRTQLPEHEDLHERPRDDSPALTCRP